ncbi:hypothetical protein P4S64_16555 [Vibrio sp. M60_M31a]
MNLVLLSHQKLSDGFAIKATFSKMFVNQIESDDDILNVVFAVHKSSLKTVNEDVPLMLYLFDDGVNDSKENAFLVFFFASRLATSRASKLTLIKFRLSLYVNLTPD